MRSREDWLRDQKDNRRPEMQKAIKKLSEKIKLKKKGLNTEE